MKFREIYRRTLRRELSQVEAAEILGISERTFRHWRDRYEADGAQGLYDRRLDRASAPRASVDEVAVNDSNHHAAARHDSQPLGR